MTKRMEDFTTLLLRLLRKMDDEADTRVNNCHAGLCDYAKHLGVKTRQYEVPIYRALAGHINEAGHPTAPDQLYPNETDEECDLVVRLSDGGILWIEVKQAAKEWYSSKLGAPKRNNAGIFRSYLLGPHARGLPRSHSAAQDFQKLEQLHQPNADFTGFLLIGFDSDKCSMAADIDELESICELRARGWSNRRWERWPDRNCPSSKISAHFWWRQVAPSRPNTVGLVRLARKMRDGK